MTNEPSRPDDSFRRALADHLKANASLWATLSSHPVLMGGGRERALAETLGGFLPRQFEALEGSIAVPDGAAGSGIAPDQADLMVVDTLHYPTLLRVGAHSLVLPEAVRAVIEVKSTLTCPPRPETALERIRKKSNPREAVDDDDAELATDSSDTHVGSRNATSSTDLLSAALQLGSLIRLREALGDVFTAVFAFDAKMKSASTLKGWLERIVEYKKLLPADQGEAYEVDKIRAHRSALGKDQLPDLIVALAPGLIAWKETVVEEEDGQIKGDSSAYVIQQVDPHDALALLIVAVLGSINVEAVAVSGTAANASVPSARVTKRVADLTRYFGRTWPPRKEGDFLQLPLE